MVDVTREPIRFSVPLGGRYESDSNADGTWNVRDVPVLVTYGPMGIDEDWLRDAISVAQIRYAEGHVAPLHAHHHNFSDSSDYETDSVEDAGLFLPTRLGEISYEGKPTTALFSDFLGVPASIYARILSRELKYRSVEVLDPRRREVNSCALLSHECPKFRLPMVTIGRQDGVRLVASAASSGDLSRACVFMSSANDESFVNANPQTKSEGRMTQPAKFAAAPGAPAAQPPAGAGDVSDKLIAAITSGNTAVMAAISSMGEKLAQCMSEKPSDEEGSGPGASEDDESATKARASGEPPRQNSTLPIEQSPLVARLEKAHAEKFRALEERAAKAEKFAEALRTERATEKRVRAAIFRLEKASVKVDETYETELRAKADKGGEVLEEHVETRVKFGAAEPPPWAGSTRREGDTGELPAELVEFKKQGPAKFEEAQKSYGEWLDLDGTAQSMLPLKDYLHYTVTVEPRSAAAARKGR